MSIFGNNTTFLGRYDSNEIAADESYVGFTGLANILIENAYNEQAVFEAVIADDFRELMGRSVLEASELEAITESRISDFFKTIKKLIDKFIAKIKGVFKSLVAKFSVFTTRDNEALLKKYEDGKKFTGKGVKIKYRKPIKDIKTEINVQDVFDQKDIGLMDIFGTTSKEQLKNSAESVKEVMKKYDISEEETIKEFFAEEKEVELSDIKEEIIDTLKTAKADGESLKKAEAEIIDVFNNVKSVLDKIQKSEGKEDIADKELKDIYSDNVYKDYSKHSKDSELFAAQLNEASSLIQTAQTTITKFINNYTKVLIFKNKQARSAFSVLVTGPVAENACIANAIMEASNYEFDSCFEE